MSLPRRIAVISVHGCPNPLASDNGGMNVYLNDLSREMGQRGIKVDVFTLQHGGGAPGVEEFAPNARVVHLDAGGGGGDGSKELLYSRLPDFLCSLLRFVDENGLRYDLVHSHYWLSGWVGSALQARWHVPHIVTFHTLGELKNRARQGVSESDLRIAIEKETMAGADRLIATSDVEKAQMTGLYEAEPSRIEVIPCGVDLKLFRPGDKSDAKRRLGLAGAKVALYVGRIDPVKGVDLLLRAVEGLDDRSNLKLVVVGASRNGELERLKGLRKQLGLERNVSFVGAKEHGMLPLYYLAADVCLIASYYESFCMVGLEALSCGTPVIASRVGYLEAIVRHGENGYLVEGHCPESFAERLEMVLSNDALHQALCANARDSVQRFSWPVIAERIIGLYRSAIGNATAA